MQLYYNISVISTLGAKETILFELALSYSSAKNSRVEIVSLSSCLFIASRIHTVATIMWTSQHYWVIQREVLKFILAPGLEEASFHRASSCSYFWGCLKSAHTWINFRGPFLALFFSSAFQWLCWWPFSLWEFMLIHGKPEHYYKLLNCFIF